MTAVGAGDGSLAVRLESGVAALEATAWDAVAGTDNPFLSHAFLSALEQSGSVGPGTGWQPSPLVLKDGETLNGALPAYLKSHSQGEYVFDHSWADAWSRAGGSYYPKLQIAAPFTPVPGPRILTQAPDTAPPLIRAAEALVVQNQLSSAHATFVEEGQIKYFEEAGWLVRQGMQFHWFNAGYRSFDDFLAELAARKRKAIKKERALAQAQVNIVQLHGKDIQEHHWDAFWLFYQDTGARKWGRPYLTREFFSLASQSMPENLLLFLAEQDGQPVAGALNFVGTQALYGRYWGCVKDIPFLHFELCYYQAIEAAIARGLARVEAGAQGDHKLARGYVATPTWSAHYIPHDGFRSAIHDFLKRERSAIEHDIAFLGELAPFKKADR